MTKERRHHPMMPAEHAERIRRWHENAYRAMTEEGAAELTFSYLGRTIVVPPGVQPITGMSHPLGEAVLASSNAVRRAVAETDVNAELIAVAGCGLVILFALWWLYFLHPAGPRLEDRRNRSYRWGYGHYGLFASLAALGAGLEVAVEQTGHELHLSPTGASYAVAVPAASFIALLWGVHRAIADVSRVHLGTAVAGIAVLLVLPLATPAIGPVADLALMALTCVGVVTVASWDARR